MNTLQMNRRNPKSSSLETDPRFGGLHLLRSIDYPAVWTHTRDPFYNSADRNPKGIASFWRVHNFHTANPFDKDIVRKSATLRNTYSNYAIITCCLLASGFCILTSHKYRLMKVDGPWLVNIQLHFAYVKGILRFLFNICSLTHLLIRFS